MIYAIKENSNESFKFDILSEQESIEILQSYGLWTEATISENIKKFGEWIWKKIQGFAETISKIIPRIVSKIKKILENKVIGQKFIKSFNECISNNNFPEINYNKIDFKIASVGPQDIKAFYGALTVGNFRMSVLEDHLKSLAIIEKESKDSMNDEASVVDALRDLGISGSNGEAVYKQIQKKLSTDEKNLDFIGNYTEKIKKRNKNQLNFLEKMYKNTNNTEGASLVEQARKEFMAFFEAGSKMTSFVMKALNSTTLFYKNCITLIVNHNGGNLKQLNAPS